MDTLFGLLNVLPLPWWLSMLLFPRSRTTRTLVISPWPFIGLAIVEAVLLLAAVSAGGVPSSLDLTGLWAATGAWGFLALWAHLVTLNLFAGVWIFRDARLYGRLPRLELVATFFGGPLGLGLYLWRRRGWSAGDPVRIVN